MTAARIAGMLLTVANVFAAGAQTRPASAPAATVEFTDVELRRILQLSPLPPLPDDPTNRFADDPGAARLGQFLFFDAGLSANGKVSCATCHDPARAFTDGKQLAEALGVGTRHTPTILNAAYQRWLFWDGRADSLWAQVVHPLESPLEMGSSRVATTRYIAAQPKLRAAYERVFGASAIFDQAARLPRAARPLPEQPSDALHRAWESLAPTERDAVDRVLANVGKALAAYERKLITPNSPLDQMVAAVRSGDARGRDALSPAAQRGLQLFVGAAKCHFCHQGPLLSDMEFHSTLIPPLDRRAPRDAARYAGARIVAEDVFNARGPFSDARDGTAARRLEFLANRPDNWGLFRTPTLRNVALTPPYMHQGQFATLAQVVEHYSTMRDAISTGHHKRETILNPLRLSAEQSADLVALLESLTSPPPPDELLRAPAEP